METKIEQSTKPKILIVEDDDMLVEIYKKKFEKGDFAITIVKDGKAAISEAQKLQPDLILLDLVMPEMDGFEALTLLKENPKTANIKVIIATNVSQDSDKKKALELGADGFLVKSDYDLGTLSEKIKSFL